MQIPVNKYIHIKYNVVFTDPNIPGLMKEVNGKPVVGGDIDDLFMILDVITTSKNTLIVIGGEHGSSEVRFKSFIAAIDQIPYIKNIYQYNSCQFISESQFMANYIKLGTYFGGYYIFCPISKTILDYLKNGKGIQIFMQGKSLADFNVKSSYDDTKTIGNDEFIKKELIPIIKDTQYPNGIIEPIDSLKSGTPIPISDIIHPFIDIAKKTALAKTLGLGGIKTFLYGFFVCSGQQNINTHLANDYSDGIDLQDMIFSKISYTIPESRVGKGNTSIPLLNYISKDKKYKTLVYSYLDSLNKQKNTTSLLNKGKNGQPINTFVSTLLQLLFPISTSNSRLLQSNIERLLSTPQGNQGFMDFGLQVMILVIFGYCYKVCGENLNHIFYTEEEATKLNKQIGEIKEFNHIDVNKLIETVNQNVLKDMFSNLQLWDLVGYLRYKPSPDPKLVDAYDKNDVKTVKITVNAYLKEMLGKINLAQTGGRRKSKNRKVKNRRTKNRRRSRRS